MSRTLQRSALVNYDAEKMFDLVNDIEAYPSFMPGCARAKIIEKKDCELVAKLTLAKSGIEQSFTTRNQFQRPSSINIALVDGPFSVFKGLWLFEPIQERGCKVSFKLEYKFKNAVLGLTLSNLLEKVSGEQVTAICDRAKTLYG